MLLVFAELLTMSVVNVHMGREILICKLQRYASPIIFISLQIGSLICRRHAKCTSAGLHLTLWCKQQ